MNQKRRRGCSFFLFLTLPSRPCVWFSVHNSRAKLVISWSALGTPVAVENTPKTSLWQHETGINDGRPASSFIHTYDRELEHVRAPGYQPQTSVRLFKVHVYHCASNIFIITKNQYTYDCIIIRPLSRIRQPYRAVILMSIMCYFQKYGAVFFTIFFFLNPFNPPTKLDKMLAFSSFLFCSFISPFTPLFRFSINNHYFHFLNLVRT